MAVPNDLVAETTRDVLGEIANDDTRADVRPPGMITRSQVAKITGLSVPTVIRREKEGVLSPRVVNGVHYFDEQVVRKTVTTLRQRVAVASLGATSGDVAADVFTDLDDGLSPVEIVKRRRYPPDAVKALVAQHAEFSGGLVLPADDVRALCQAVGVESEDLARKLRSVVAFLQGTVLAANAARALAQGQAVRAGPVCLVCYCTNNVFMCASCMSQAKFEHRMHGGEEQVRAAVYDGFGTTYAPWTRKVSRAPPQP